MNRIITFLVSLAIVINLNGQEGDTTKIGVGQTDIVTVTESDAGTNVNVKDDFVIVDETDDTIKVKLGNRAISIVEDGNKTNVEIIEKEDFEEHGWKEKSERFKGHWSGVDLGMNNLVDRNFDLAGATAETGFLDLNTERSWEVDLNFMQYNIPMGQHLGWVTGMGFKWNEYWFDRNNNITKDAVNDIILPLYPAAGVIYEKSKFNTFFLTVPLLLEMQFGEKGRAYISAGVIGDLKLASKTRLKYVENGTTQKDKVKGDFNLSPLRYHFTTRLGYRFIRLFATYSPVPLFKNNAGPEVYPVTVGLSLINFR